MATKGANSKSMNNTIKYDELSTSSNHGPISNDTPSIYDERKKHWMPLDIGFSKISPLLELGNSRPLQQSDLGDIPTEDSSTYIYDKFTASRLAHSSSLSYCLFNAYGKPFVIVGGVKFFHDSCLFLGPIILRSLINFLQSPSAPFSHGIVLACLLLITQATMAVCLRHYFW